MSDLSFSSVGFLVERKNARSCEAVDSQLPKKSGSLPMGEGATSKKRSGGGGVFGVRKAWRGIYRNPAGLVVHERNLPYRRVAVPDIMPR